MCWRSVWYSNLHRGLNTQCDLSAETCCFSFQSCLIEKSLSIDPGQQRKPLLGNPCMSVLKENILDLILPLIQIPHPGLSVLRIPVKRFDLSPFRKRENIVLIDGGLIPKSYQSSPYSQRGKSTYKVLPNTDTLSPLLTSICRSYRSRSRSEGPTLFLKTLSCCP